MWNIVFHSNDKKILSFNGNREEFTNLRDLLNRMLSDQNRI
jgi:hypothetical protein